MKNLVHIEYLKAFSVMYIVGYWHLFNYTTAFPEYYNIFTYEFTRIVLGLFVLLSGFLVGGSAKRALSVFGFYKKRLLRIYPLYAIAVVLFYMFGLNDGLVSLKSLVFISMYTGPAPATLWFITMIFLFYLLSPLLLRYVDNTGKYLSFTCAIFIVTLILLVLFKSVDHRVLLYFPCYCLGVYCSRHGVVTRFINMKLVVFLMSLYCALLLFKSESWTLEQIKSIPLILSISYLIFFISYSNEYKFKSFRVISRLSYSSYAMYLFHRPIYEALIYLYFPISNEGQVFYLMFYCLLIIVFTSWGMQKFYDLIYSFLFQTFYPNDFKELK